MIHSIGSWADRVQGGNGILRHFNAISDLEPLLLINMHYDSRSLNVEFVSFTTPMRYASKWSKDLCAGTRLKLIGFTNRLNIIEPAFCCKTSLETSDCKMTGIEWCDGKLKEREFSGVMLQLHQTDKPVIIAECTMLQLGGIQPIESDEADRYKNPERYA